MARCWLIDGMNVIGSRPDGWWNDPARAMRALVDSLDDYARITGDEVVVVFDKDPGLTSETARAQVVVASRKGRNAADHEIIEIVRREPEPFTGLVVTSDKRLKQEVTALGARVVSSGSFRDRLDAALDNDNRH